MGEAGAFYMRGCHSTEWLFTGYSAPALLVWNLARHNIARNVIWFENTNAYRYWILRAGSRLNSSGTSTRSSQNHIVVFKEGIQKCFQQSYGKVPIFSFKIKQTLLSLQMDKWILYVLVGGICQWNWIIVTSSWEAYCAALYVFNHRSWLARCQCANHVIWIPWHLLQIINV